MAHLKITLSKKKFYRAGWLSFWPQKGQKGTFGLPCARTFQGLHSVRFWTPTIFSLSKDISKSDPQKGDFWGQKMILI
jgi:hypothetical protein